MDRSAGEVARLFNVGSVRELNVGSEIYPGYPGLVIAEGEVQSMVWGFPLVMRSKKTREPLKPKPVNNARSDKLDSNFWRSSVRERRCLIPVSRFAEAEGERGRMTRTWFSPPDDGLLVCAGIWRESAEWGRVYSMVMTDANATVEPVHDRMPVVLDPEGQGGWLSLSPDEAIELCRPYKGTLLTDKTADPWARRKTSS